MFEWDANNVRKVMAHGITPIEVEEALQNDPLLVYEQDAGTEQRFVYYGESRQLCLMAIVITERGDKIPVITAYDLDASQKTDFLSWRAEQQGGIQ